MDHPGCDQRYKSLDALKINLSKKGALIFDVHP